MLNQKRSFLNLVFISPFLIIAISCASTGNHSVPLTSQPNSSESVEQRIAAEPEANSSEQIAKRAADTFANAEGLVPAQKEALRKIYLATYEEAISIRTEIGKAKSLLFKVVSRRESKNSEVEQVRQKIVALDQKRLAVMFKSLADVQKVVGTGQDREDIYKHFFDYEYPRYENVSQKR